jgi:hypothetical protein
VQVLAVYRKGVQGWKAPRFSGGDAEPLQASYS